MATCAGSEFSMAVNYALSCLHKSDYVLKPEQIVSMLVACLTQVRHACFGRPSSDSNGTFNKEQSRSATSLGLPSGVNSDTQCVG